MHLLCPATATLPPACLPPSSVLSVPYSKPFLPFPLPTTTLRAHYTYTFHRCAHCGFALYWRFKLPPQRLPWRAAAPSTKGMRAARALPGARALRPLPRHAAAPLRAMRAHAAPHLRRAGENGARDARTARRRFCCARAARRVPLPRL